MPASPWIWISVLSVALIAPPLSRAQFAQQGAKLVGTGTVNAANQGISVALSADGSTAISGGPADNSNLGAAFIFTRVNGVWTQQAELIAVDSIIGTPPAAVQQGQSVALSGDGNTAIMGGINDNSGIGAAWIFTRNSRGWAQQGDKLVGTTIAGSTPHQGNSVAISI